MRKSMSKKVVIKIPDVQTLVLPPPNEVCRWFGLPSTLADALKQLARRAGVAPPADPKTLRKMTTVGISDRKVSEIKEFVLQLEPGLEALIDEVLESDYYFFSNGWTWETCLRSFATEQLLAPGHAVGFIRERITSEQRLIKRVRQALKSGASRQELAHVILDSLDYSCLVPKDIMERGAEGWALLLREEDSQAQVDLLRWLHYAKIDFYYRLLCEFSLDFLVFMKKMPIFSEVKEVLVSEGLFSRMAPAGQSADAWWPFERVMDRWRLQLGGEAPLSWRTLASHMPTPKRRRAEMPKLTTEEDLAQADFETQLRRLHEWRNGTVPQDDQLHTFVSNLVPDGNSIGIAFLSAKIAIAWGALIRQEIELVTAHGAMELQEKIALLASFPDYWDVYRDQAAELAA